MNSSNACGHSNTTWQEKYFIGKVELERYRRLNKLYLEYLNFEIKKEKYSSQGFGRHQLRAPEGYTSLASWQIFCLSNWPEPAPVTSRQSRRETQTMIQKMTLGSWSWKVMERNKF